MVIAPSFLTKNRRKHPPLLQDWLLTAPPVIVADLKVDLHKLRYWHLGIGIKFHPSAMEVGSEQQ